MYYFRFTIPKQDKDKTVAYSPGWHGTMSKCPKNVTVLLYNDKEGYGIAQADDTFVPPEVTVIDALTASKELSACPTKLTATKLSADYQTDLTMDGIPKRIWYGANIKDRWKAVEAAIPQTH
jgi:hypothetical protein